MIKVIGSFLFALGAIGLISMAPAVFSSSGSPPILAIILAAILCGVGEMLRNWGSGPAEPTTLKQPYANTNTTAEAEYDAGLASALHRNLTDAESHFIEALRLNPNYDPARASNRLISDWRHEKITEDALHHLFLASRCGNENDLEGGISAASTAIQEAPDYALAYVQRGVYVARQGRHRDAVKDFAEALRLDPSSSDTYTARGFSLDALGDSAAALEDFDHAILLDPRSAFAYSNRGVLRMNAGQTAEACSDFKKAAELGFPANYEASIRSGKCMREQSSGTS